MGGGGGSTNTSTIQSTTPWDGAQNYLSGGMSGAWDLYKHNPYPTYTGQRVADQNQYQKQAVDSIAQRATNGSPLMQSAQSALTDTMGGKYLNADGGTNPYQGLLSGGQNAYAGSNPYLDQAINKASGDVIRNYQTGTAAQLDRSAAQANAFGSSGHSEQMGQNQYQLGRALGDVSSGMRMQDYGMQQQLAESGLNRNLQAQMGNAQLAEGALGRNANLYNAERQRMLQGNMFAPQLAQADYTDAQMLGQAGNQQQLFQQQNLDAQQQAWKEQAFAPYANFDQYKNNILQFTGMGGQSSSSGSQPYASNAFGNALGGGLLGLNAYNSGLFSGLGGTAGYTASQLGAGAGAGYLYGTGAAGLTASEAAAMAALFAV